MAEKRQRLNHEAVMFEGLISLVHEVAEEGFRREAGDMIDLLWRFIPSVDKKGGDFAGEWAELDAEEIPLEYTGRAGQRIVLQPTERYRNPAHRRNLMKKMQLVIDQYHNINPMYRKPRPNWEDSIKRSADIDGIPDDDEIPWKEREVSDESA